MGNVADVIRGNADRQLVVTAGIPDLRKPVAAGELPSALSSQENVWRHLHHAAGDFCRVDEARLRRDGTNVARGSMHD